MSNLITFGIYFGVFAVIALTVLRRPAVAMGGMMCMFGLEQWAQSRSSFFFIHQELTNVLMASMLLWGVLARPIKGLPVLRPFPKVAWWVIGLYAFAALSMFWVPEFSLSLKQFKAALPYLLAVGCLMPLVVGDLADLRAGLLMALAVGTPILAMLFFDTRWVGRTVVFDEGAAFGSIRGNTGNPLAVASLAGWVAVTAALMNFRGAARALQVVRWGDRGAGGGGAAAQRVARAALRAADRGGGVPAAEPPGAGPEELRRRLRRHGAVPAGGVRAVPDVRRGPGPVAGRRDGGQLAADAAGARRWWC